MTTEHPITPSPELVRQWYQNGPEHERDLTEYVATQAARWGWEQRGAANEDELQKARDEELEACCKVLRSRVTTFSADAFLEAHRLSDELRDLRRPKPPSLKEQAIAALQVFGPGGDLTPDEVDTIRRALESLPD